MLETKVIDDVAPCDKTPRAVAQAFARRLEAGAKIVAAGSASSDPESLLRIGYTPRHQLRFLDTSYYLSNLREDANFRFFVAYLVIGTGPRAPIYPRIFYKDSSLVWRVATYYIQSEDENWIGKGDLKTIVEGDEEVEYSAEETTNLPLEIQTALDLISRRGSSIRRDNRAIDLILRRAPDDRIAPYRDFAGPRRRAMSDRRNQIHGGRDIAYFRRANDPASLRFVSGFVPDFSTGVLDFSELRSRMYGGLVRKYRILSTNRRIQYQFVAARKHTWIIPPQTLTTQIMSYGVRTVDVNVADDLCVPGYEYHFIDETEDPPQLYSQIPEGYVGAASEVDSSRADASPWIDELPVIQEFKRRVPLPW